MVADLRDSADHFSSLLLSASEKLQIVHGGCRSKCFADEDQPLCLRDLDVHAPGKGNSKLDKANSCAGFAVVSPDLERFRDVSEQSLL